MLQDRSSWVRDSCDFDIKLRFLITIFSAMKQQLSNEKLARGIAYAYNLSTNFENHKVQITFLQL